jgi:hypothetical protein
MSKVPTNVDECRPCPCLPLFPVGLIVFLRFELLLDEVAMAIEALAFADVEGYKNYHLCYLIYRYKNAKQLVRNEKNVIC